MMKYAVSIILIVIAFACVYIMSIVPYNYGEPRVITRTVSEIVYDGTNTGIFVALTICALAAGVGGVILGCMAIDSDKVIRERHIDLDRERARAAK